MIETPNQRKKVSKSGDTSPTANRAATAFPPQQAVQITNKI
jgi:hypothetical protein